MDSESGSRKVGGVEGQEKGGTGRRGDGRTASGRFGDLRHDQWHSIDVQACITISVTDATICNPGDSGELGSWENWLCAAAECGLRFLQGLTSFGRGSSRRDSLHDHTGLRQYRCGRGRRTDRCLFLRQPLAVGSAGRRSKSRRSATPCPAWTLALRLPEILQAWIKDPFLAERSRLAATSPRMGPGGPGASHWSA